MKHQETTSLETPTEYSGLTQEYKEAILARWSYQYGNFILWGNEVEILVGTCGTCFSLVDHRSFKDHAQWHRTWSHTIGGTCSE